MRGGLFYVVVVLPCLSLAHFAGAKATLRVRDSGSGSTASGSVSSGSAAGSSVAGRVCAMSNDKESPSKEALNWCTEYAENSCCSVAEDNKLMKEFDMFWRSAAGHCPGCLTNVKAFQCAYSCSPSQADFVTVKRDAAGKMESATIRMCSQFCSSYHSSCSNVTIAEMEGNNANAFCQGFIDTAKKLHVEINQYDCYNTPAAPNRCDGSKFGEIEKPGTNWFFIVSCVILGLICATLVASVLCWGNETSEKRKYEHANVNRGEDEKFLNNQ